MDSKRFDALSRALATAGSRRRILGLLSGLPIAGWLLGPDDTAAQPGRSGQRHHRQHRHHHAKTQRRHEQRTQHRTDARSEACIPSGHPCPKKARGKKGKKLGCSKCCQGSFVTDASGKKVCGCQPNGGSCTPETAASCCSGFCDGTTCQSSAAEPCERTCPTTCCAGQCCPDPAAICHPTTGACCVAEDPALTCTGRCGEVVNTCGQIVTCPPCTCDPACGFCELCNETSDTCEPDAAKDGLSCGACQQCAGGTCQACAYACCSNQCCTNHDAVCHATTATCCVPEDAATTCGSQVCGTAINNCGQEVDCTGCNGCCDGDTCVASADQNNQICGRNGDACSNCLSSHSLCRSGTCQACDVCPSGACAFTSVQAAINAIPQLDTILICPGTYDEDAGNGSGVSISRSLSLIGAGDGAGDATNTILRPAVTDRTVVLIFSTPAVRLEGLRITGGTGGRGRGVGILGAVVTVQTCTIINNQPDSNDAGGIRVEGGSVLTLNNTQISGNTGAIGGIFVLQATVNVDTLSHVTGNTATSCCDGNGGIFNYFGAVDLPAVDNVTGNTSPGSNKNCGVEGGAFTGPGGDFCLTH